eukprot:scaffold2.g6969.t1
MADDSVSGAMQVWVPRLPAAIQQAKAKGHHLIQSTSAHFERALQTQSDEWGQLLKRVGTSERKPQLHKSASESSLRLPRRRAFSAGAPPAPLHHAASQSAEVPAWLQALNNTIIQARAAQQQQQPMFRLPNRESLEEQAQKLVKSASSISLASVKDQLLQKPRDALSSAQTTLENCQQNLQSLHSSLQASLAERCVTLERTLAQSLGEPGSPSTSSTRLAALLSPISPPRGGGSSGALATAGDGGEAAPAAAQALAAPALAAPPPAEQQQQQGQQEVDILSPWAVLPGYMRARETAAIEALTAETEGESEGEGGGGGEPSTSGRLWGPFQQQQAERRRARSQGSSLREDGRQVTIVTTAALPWMTGTAVNPLLRAAYLARDRHARRSGAGGSTGRGGGSMGRGSAKRRGRVAGGALRLHAPRPAAASPPGRPARRVTLMIPWLAKADQGKVYPNGMTFDSPEEQEAYVREWARKRTGFDSDFKVTFYPGRYAPEKCSILPVGDPTQYIPEHEADVAILEEPEHLNWYHHGRRWTDKFAHVVGVVHTNYLDYARREEGGSTKEMLLRHINNWVCRIHCHKVVKLSDATTEFVHGVAESFLAVGAQKSQPPPAGEKRFGKGAYFIGKVVWGKGYTELLDLLSKHMSAGSEASAEAADGGGAIEMDCYGTGEDLPAVFINPSTSDVVATTTAEALAMGKWVVCADHPSNRFFSQFKNCLIFKSPEEFSQHVQHALAHEPNPMGPEELQRLTWEAATERFLDVSELSHRDLRPRPVAAVVDNLAWAAHNALVGLEPIRLATGAGANTRDNPQRITDYEPSASDVGGLFDNRSRAKKAHAASAAASAATAPRSIAPAAAAAKC